MDFPSRPPRPAGNHRWAAITVAALLLIAVGGVSAFGAFNGWGHTTPTAALTTTPTPTATPTQTETLAVQDVVLNGARADADPASRPVRDAGPTSGGWADLAQLFGGDTPYTECVADVIGVDRKSWSTYEKHAGSELIIFASNTGKMTNAEIRQIAANDLQNAGVENLPDLPIRRVNGGFVNTKWSPDGGCEEFMDARRLVRVSMVPVTDDKLDTSRGVFIGCHNPWRLVKGEVKASSRKTNTSSTPRGPATTKPPRVVVTKRTCPPGMHGGWVKGHLVCKDDPKKGSAHNKVPDQQKPNPRSTQKGHEQPDKPADPPKKAKNPDPPAPPKTPRPEPPDPADGAPDSTEAPTACVVAPGEITC